MMKEYYDGKKVEAVECLSDILGYKVENSSSGVTAALALALRDGTARIAAIADRAANKWFWADNETCEEEYKNSLKASEEKHEECADAEHHEEAASDHAEAPAAVEAAKPAVA